MPSIENIRKQFPMLNREDHFVYFDNAATTLKPQRMIDAVMAYYQEKSVNIHRGDYDLSFKVSQEYDQVRSKLAEWLNCNTNEIVFTSGASAGLNLVAHHYGANVLQAGDVILTTPSEHASNLLPWFKAAEHTGATIEYLPMDKYGQVLLDEVEQVIHNRVKVVAIASVSNVLGAILPVAKIAEQAHKVGAIVLCDGAQSVAHMETDMQSLGVDFFAFSAHKMFGPTGVGVLYGKFDLLDALEPLAFGGGSNTRYQSTGQLVLKPTPERFETGTPAIEGVLGLGAAIDFINEVGLAWIFQREKTLFTYLYEQAIKIPHLEIYNSISASCLLSFNVKGIFPQDVGMYLNSKNIAVRSGNHCSKILHEVIGASESVRASIAFYNTEAEIDCFIEALQEITLEKCIDLYL